MAKICGGSFKGLYLILRVHVCHCTIRICVSYVYRIPFLKLLYVLFYLNTIRVNKNLFLFGTGFFMPAAA